MEDRMNKAQEIRKTPSAPSGEHQDEATQRTAQGVRIRSGIRCGLKAMDTPNTDLGG
jgi:hypothetical protein